MDSVAFISTETGDDLIVAFAVYDPDDPTEIESLTLLRTPKYEALLAECERGVQASFERFDDDDDYLEEVQYSTEERVLHLKTRARFYELDLWKVDRKDLAAMRKVLRKMNFDRRLKLSGL